MAIVMAQVLVPRRPALDQRRTPSKLSSAQSPSLPALPRDGLLRLHSKGSAAGRSQRRRAPAVPRTDSLGSIQRPASSSSSAALLARAAEKIGSLADRDYLFDDPAGSTPLSSFAPQSSWPPSSWPVSSMPVASGEADEGPVEHRQAPTEVESDSSSPRNRQQDARTIQRISLCLNVPADVVQQACDLFVKFADRRELQGRPQRRDIVHGGLDLPLPSSVSHLDRLTRSGFAKVLRELMACSADEQLPKGIVAEAFQYADRDGGGELDFNAFVIWLASHGFSEYLNVEPSQRALRTLAKKHEMDLSDVERYKRHFDELDSHGSGLLGAKDFKVLLHRCAKVPAAAEIPAFRVERFWRIADKGHYGEIDFDDFLVFYRNHFDAGGADSLGFESYYRGIRRVACLN